MRPDLDSICFGGGVLMGPQFHESWESISWFGS